MTDDAPRRFGRYQLVERIARGGMAEVFKAKSHGVEGFEKVVVVKRVLPELADDPRFVETFLSEARLAVSLSHANIVQVFDLGREDDAYFLAMEHVAGMDLALALRASRRAGGAPPVALAVYIACEVARALDYAHRRKDTAGRPLGLVHRDISPQNVLLSYEGEVKVTDFGIARCRALFEASSASRGKPAYAAPEQLEGGEVDARADLYGLAVTLYEALAGRSPFLGDTPDATRRNVLAGAHRPLREARPDAPEALHALVERMLARDPAARLPAAAQMYEELAAVLQKLGRRVGPHDLADWIQTLRPYRADPPPPAPGPEGEVDVEALPEVDADAVSEVDADAIREVEPDDPRQRVTDLDTTLTLTPAAVPRAESPSQEPPDARRDATLVALSVKAEAPVAEEALRPLVQAARRHGATVIEQGPATLALAFGVAHPDGRDMQRATALALRFHAAALKAATAREPIASVGAAVHPARVTVRADGSLEDDGALREALALVKTLAGAARNRVLASDLVAAAGGDHFESVAVAEGAVALKGTVAPARRRVAGRKDLFRLFGELLAKAANEGAQVLEVSAGAGVGKTRFLDEVIYRLRKMGHPVTWHAAECLYHEREAPLAAVRAMLRTLLTIDDTDADAVVREKARRLRDFGLTPEEMLAAGAVLGVVNAAPASPSHAASKGLRGALRKIFQGAVSGQVSVFAWDGVEHMDAASRAQLRDLMADTAAQPILYVVSGRPGAWDGPAARHRVRLDPLSPDDVATLVALRLGNRAPPRELVDDLVARCGGNPFFIEEQLKSYVLSDAVVTEGDDVRFTAPAEVELPRTMRDMAESAMAPLDDTARRVLRAAAAQEGVAPGALAKSVGRDLASVESALASLRGSGLVSDEGGAVRVTDTALRAALRDASR